jgi:hypothetical protein
VVTNPFTVIQGPCSWSHPLCRLVLWNRVLEPSIDIRIIHICNFRLRVFTFLLVLFDSLAGKAFLARSIKLCLVDNQWSSGVTVARFESCLIWSRIANVEISTNRTYRLPLGRSGQYSSPYLPAIAPYIPDRVVDRGSDSPVEFSVVHLLSIGQAEHNYYREVTAMFHIFLSNITIRRYNLFLSWLPSVIALIIVCFDFIVRIT